jgi:hypothetical protein
VRADVKMAGIRGIAVVPFRLIHNQRRAMSPSSANAANAASTGDAVEVGATLVEVNEPRV